MPSLCALRVRVHKGNCARSGFVGRCQSQSLKVFCMLAAWLGELGSPERKLPCSRMNRMAREKISEHEWLTFVSVAERLQIPLPELLHEDVRFSALESAGHMLGRAVAQITTERLAFARAERMTGPQPCPVCRRQCPLAYRDRDLETIDGPIELPEPVCHCSACRRDFFPSASTVGA